ncbi:MAG: KEOPS complex kinase/ATPase Bud32 [archaeon]
MKTIAQGAEAILVKNKGLLEKRRIPKSYRHKELDFLIRKHRTRRESKLLQKAKNIIPVPEVKKTEEFTIKMQFLGENRLSEQLDKFPEKKQLKICDEIGKNIAKLHENNIMHGDLTTSNMLLVKTKIYFIDFGLGFHSARIEDRAVDLYLLVQALKSKHFKRWQNLFKSVLKGYKNYENYNKVMQQFQKVQSRGRYKHGKSEININ